MDITNGDPQHLNSNAGTLIDPNADLKMSTKLDKIPSRSPMWRLERLPTEMILAIFVEILVSSYCEVVWLSETSPILGAWFEENHYHVLLAVVRTVVGNAPGLAEQSLRFGYTYLCHEHFNSATVPVGQMMLDHLDLTKDIPTPKLIPQSMYRDLLYWLSNDNVASSTYHKHHWAWDFYQLQPLMGWDFHLLPPALHADIYKVEVECELFNFEALGFWAENFVTPTDPVVQIPTLTPFRSVEELEVLFAELERLRHGAVAKANELRAQMQRRLDVLVPHQRLVEFEFRVVAHPYQGAPVIWFDYAPDKEVSKAYYAALHGADGEDTEWVAGQDNGGHDDQHPDVDEGWW